MMVNTGAMIANTAIQSKQCCFLSKGENQGIWRKSSLGKEENQLKLKLKFSLQLSLLVSLLELQLYNLVYMVGVCARHKLYR